VLLALVERREKRPDRAVQVLAALCQQFPQNYLYRMELVHALMEAKNTGRARAEMAELGRYPNLGKDKLEAFRRKVEPKL
jgi:predicted Zn-dependent protease